MLLVLMNQQFLSYFFYAFGSSSFLLSCVTIFVFTAALLMFLKICVLLEIKVKSYFAILLFGGLPGVLLITIEPYREVFLIFFTKTLKKHWASVSSGWAGACAGTWAGWPHESRWSSSDSASTGAAQFEDVENHYVSLVGFLTHCCQQLG